jgi:hypothetical protein
MLCNVDPETAGKRYKTVPAIYNSEVTHVSASLSNSNEMIDMNDRSELAVRLAGAVARFRTE